MSEPQNTDSSTTDSGATTKPPVATVVTNTPNTPTPPATVPDFSNLLTQLSALPEQIASSVKEAVGTPKPTVTAKPEDKVTEVKPVDKPDDKPTSTPGRKSFTDWWFN
jgi:hypothetical protein